jgi:hypothetical protein
MAPAEPGAILRYRIRRRTDMIELAYRMAHGIEVSLLWSEDSDAVLVAVNDDRTGETFAVEPPREKALDAFYHPYVYAAAA